MSVRRICSREVDVINPTECVRCAAERMRQRTVGALVVVSDDNMPIGIVTDRDIAIRVVADALDPSTTKIAEVMTTCPRTLCEEMPMEVALSMMRSGGFRRLPIVDLEQKLVGILTLDDILMLLACELSDAGRLIERETPQSAAQSPVSAVGD